MWFMKNSNYMEESKSVVAAVEFDGQETNWISPELDFSEIVSHYRRSLSSQSTVRANGRNAAFVKSYLYAIRLLCKKAVKRVTDVSISLFLLILFLPILLVIAILIKLDSKGPAIFTQMRIGVERRSKKRNNRLNEELWELDNRFRNRRTKNYRGRPFKIYKFRSMSTQAPTYERSPSSINDNRLTRIGRFLRKTSLDELPQLFNVLKGDMSLVGPRPEMPFLVVEYNDYHAIRLQMKPGITGLWQLYGRRDVPIHQNLNYDLEYIRNWSLALDLRIIMQTAVAVVRGINV
jgi:lipopolysaccharide/colanic/teichoic acid biosynthesis glycosyltransferase